MASARRGSEARRQRPEGVECVLLGREKGVFPKGGAGLFLIHVTIAEAPNRPRNTAHTQVEAVFSGGREQSLNVGRIGPCKSRRGYARAAIEVQAPLPGISVWNAARQEPM
jgi:hypothetical protein